ncbi:hypothetical protein [Streptomyces sp. NPDC006333]|uniref:hypothetical protein n=1 Tax=Streptomyces sp. NPDC006333 TaxID=3156753 RepID=UPI0033AFDB0B
MTHLHSQHNPFDSPESALPDDFENAVFVRVDEPDEPDGIRITYPEFLLCSPVPLRMMVLLHWRHRERAGEARTAESIWSTLTGLGVLSSDGESPLTVEEVREAVDFLLAERLVTPTADGAL